MKEKIARQKEAIKADLDRDLPSWFTWAIKPAASLTFDLQQRRDSLVGRGGEIRASLNFWLLLPGNWILINDVVLEPEPDDFIQIDHILIGSPGVYLIETKAWEGAFLGYKDFWKRKDGSDWVRCESPTRQNQRHWVLFGKWAGETAKIPLDPKEWLFPMVLFTRANWLRVDNCSMPVYDNPFALALDLRRQSKRKVLTPEQANTIAEAIINAEPFPTDRIPTDRSGSGLEASHYQKLRARPAPSKSGSLENALESETEAVTSTPRKEEHFFSQVNEVGGGQPQSINVSPGGDKDKSDSTSKPDPTSAATVPMSPHLSPSTESSSYHPAGVDHGEEILDENNAPREQVTVKKGRTKDGRHYVKVFGTRTDAERIRAEYISRGERPDSLREDRFEKGAWFFYLGKG